jgi:hypothetical protein
MKTLVALLAALCVATPALANETVNSEKMKMMVDKKFAKMDMNSDGMISKSEHASGAEKCSWKPIAIRTA